MSGYGRNNPCPCGSGKKNKQCCGRATIRTPDEMYVRLRRLDGEASDGIQRIATQRYSKEEFLAAMAEFCPDKPGLMKEDDPEIEFFLRWYYYDWLPEKGEQPAEAFLRSKDPRVDPDVYRLVDKTIDAPYSFLQVTNVRRGESFEARDILRKLEFSIIERTATQTLEPGDILYARVVEWDGMCLMMGNGSQAMPGEYLGELVNLRAELLKENGSSKGSLSDDDLLIYEGDLRLAYFDMLEAAAHHGQDIRNTDGDPMLFHTIRYEIPSFSRAFDALRGFQPDATDADLTRAGNDVSGDAGGADLLEADDG